MRFYHRDVEYELHDDWWAEAGMEEFVPQRPAFRAGPSDIPDRQPFELSVDQVRPLRRQLSHGVFNDSELQGSAHDRVVQILKGFKADNAIPPVHVARTTSGPEGPFKLVHGAHRFYCAVATGFSHVPAVEVDDVWGDPKPES